MKLVLITLVLVILSACTNNSKEKEHDIKVSLTKLSGLVFQGDYTSALKLAEEIINSDPKNPKVYFRRAECYRLMYDQDTLKKQYLKSALDDYSKSIIIEPTADKYIARAEFFTNYLKDNKKALDDYNIAVNKDKTYLKDRANFYFTTLKDSTASFRDFRQAIVDFEASNTNKFPLRTYLDYANCLSQTDRIDEAIEYYDEILTPTKNISGKPLNDIEKNFVSSRLAELYIIKGDYLMSLEILNKGGHRTNSPQQIYCKYKLGQQEFAKKEMWKYGLECKANNVLRDKYFFELFPNEPKTPDEEEFIKKQGLKWPFN
jgi:tetratricopeptide (TPR) repeat protein